MSRHMPVTRAIGDRGRHTAALLLERSFDVRALVHEAALARM